MVKKVRLAFSRGFFDLTGVKVTLVFAKKVAFDESNHALPKIRTIYLLGADEQGEVDTIQNTINKAGASKRSLDTYVHSATKQPYSILVDKMHTLRDQAADASKSIGQFQAYLQSLKNDSEAANAALKVYSARLRQTEKAVREINLDAVTNIYVPRIQELYGTIDTLNGDLSALPIDVKKVDADLGTLKNKGDVLIDEVSKAVKEMNSAESAMTPNCSPLGPMTRTSG